MDDKCSFLLFWTVLMSVMTKGWSMLCYECVSTAYPNCGVSFSSYRLSTVPCQPPGLCALQRQRAIPAISQVAAISRTCYVPDSIPGLNSTVGCRRWTNSDNFTAFYCFCDTDLCNAATTTIRQLAPMMMMLMLLLLMQTDAALGLQASRISGVDVLPSIIVLCAIYVFVSV